ncbi:MAG: penicillin acylase family protein [Acidobacteriota bacterium]
MTWFRRFVLGLAGLALILGLVATWLLRSPWPQAEGEISVAIASSGQPGLEGEIEILRDRWGVPHIYADSATDLLFGQGYVHAQDRLWQMVFNRRLGEGRLAEVLGARGLGLDRFMRTIGIRRAAERELEQLDDQTLELMEAYAAGVNAFMASGEAPPVEMRIARFEPEPWEPVDTLIWGKVMTWILSENYRFELTRARIVAELGPEAAQQLLPPYLEGAPVIVPPVDGAYDWLVGNPLEGVDEASRWIGEPGPDYGSNNWVVHGSRTASGRPLLANDTHLEMLSPAVWYLNGLHGGGIDAVGATFPGVPFLLVGHNGRVAWGVTDMIPDTQDLYFETLDDPETPTQYRFRDAWLPLETLEERIEVRDGETEVLKVHWTRHGPIVNDVVGRLRESDPPAALRWTAHDGGGLLRSLRLLATSKDWASFRDALRSWSAPNLNFGYMDVDGNIGYQAAGFIPIRQPGHQGLLPVRGDIGEHEWQGFVPFDELPSRFNPPEGYIATANNKVVGDDYPYVLGYEWSDPFRIMRLTEVLDADEAHSVEAARELQMDVLSLPARSLRPVLLQAEAQGDLQRRALELVADWDLRLDADSAAAAVFQVWYRSLVQEVLADELKDEQLMLEYLRYYWIHGPMMVQLMTASGERWIDDIETPQQVETRQEISTRALNRAVEWLRQVEGDNPEEWAWGSIHPLVFLHRPFGQTGIGPVDDLFNVGPVPAPGDRFTVNAAWSNLRRARPYEMSGGAALRWIFDFGDPDGSLALVVPGQSGHVFHPHHQDQVTPWSEGEYLELRFRRAAVEEAAEHRLKLTPVGDR